MKTQRRQHSTEFKAKVVLEALKGHRTLNEIAACYQVHPVQVQQWKKRLVDALPTLFCCTRDKQNKNVISRTRTGRTRRQTLPADRPTQGRSGLAQKN